MLGRIAATAALAILGGIALSLRDLVLPPPRQVPLPLEDLVSVSWLLVLAIIGWFAAQVIGGPLRVVVAPAAAAVAIGAVMSAPPANQSPPRRA
jgi:hypothetical protein